MLALIALGFGALLLLGYRFHGGLLARRFGLDDSRVTPACQRADGLDYVPTPRFYLFGQHLSAIAAAGPIAGPILAARDFGWLPCLLWIALGVIVIGAVHDFAALTASVRHGARSIAEIARDELGTGAGRALMGFIFIALVYVIVAFTDITAGTFVEGTEELRGASAIFHRGGAVALASLLYLSLALVMGLVQRFLRPPLWLVTLVFVPVAFALCWVGTRFSYLLVLDARTWGFLILGYCALATVTPIWLLLQPRGYLGGFVLFGALAAGLAGLFLGDLPVQQPAFRTWDAAGSTLFPFLFVTIACGACSGFHGLVCSGTTSKQVARESHMRLVGYGAMLAEALLAFLALATVMIAADSELAGQAPGSVYGQGLGRFLAVVIGERHLALATTFGAMAFSTFVFDTLDVCTRLGRYLVQELFGWRGRAGALFGTLAVLLPPALILAGSRPGGYKPFWTLFGASNQMLAALTLFSIGVWLRREGRSAYLAFAPMLFVLAMTSWALVLIVLRNARAASSSAPACLNAAAGAALLLLALILIGAGLRRLSRPDGRAPEPERG
jgi:carbon starvation protein